MSTQPAKPTVLSRAQLLAAVQSVFPNATVHSPFDLRFALLAHEQFETRFPAALALHLAALRGTTKFTIAFDCDKFAKFACTLVSLKHAIAQGFSPDAPDGVAMGILCYRRDHYGDDAPDQGHAVNLLITEHGVETWEPQTGKFTTLTDAERTSAWAIYF